MIHTFILTLFFQTGNNYSSRLLCGFQIVTKIIYYITFIIISHEFFTGKREASLSGTSRLLTDALP